MSKQDGGPAFPLGITEAASYALKGERDASMGMPLRDYFAAKAMQGLISEPLREGEASTAYHICRNTNRGIGSAGANFAHAAYLIAGAMLAERSKS